MSAAAARFVAARIRAKPDAVLLLPTGTTPLGMYGRLVELHAEEGLSFVRATFFNLDEYLGLAPDHPASYHVYMEETFYELVDADPAGAHAHSALKEPGAFSGSRPRVVGPAESTRRVNAADFEGNRAPERAITVGMATIFEAREVLLLASGSNKARAVAAAVEGEISESVPASMLRRHPNTTFLLDREAALSLGDG